MGDRGQAAVELGLGVGLLLLPVAIAVMSFGPWSERRVLADAAAAEASRAAVLQLDVTAGAEVVAEMGANHGLAPEEMMLGWCGSPVTLPGGAAAGCTFARGSQVVAEVRVWAPLIDTPWGPVGGVWVTAVHSEPIDLYRSLG